MDYQLLQYELGHKRNVLWTSGEGSPYLIGNLTVTAMQNRELGRSVYAPISVKTTYEDWANMVSPFLERYVHPCATHTKTSNTKKGTNKPLYISDTCAMPFKNSYEFSKAILRTV